MQSLKLDLLKFTGAKTFTAKDGQEHVAIPLAANNVFTGQKGLYCSLTLMENRDGVDQYGNEGFASVDIGKDRRMAGEKGPILGNWKTVGQQQNPKMHGGEQRTAPPAQEPDDGDDIPF